jgi:hypothetical protein
MSLPPVFAAGALYDQLLQSALHQFFGRATFEIEPIPSLSSDGRLSIEPTQDPSVLSVRWFSVRHVLHVPASRPFTPHEVRLARAIGHVLAARYRAIFDPKEMLERGELFRGAIEDRYVGAFLQERAYARGEQKRADLISGVIEVLRVAALSSYENRAISSGVLLIEGKTDAALTLRHPDALAYAYSQALTGVKSFYRICDGVETLFLVNCDGVVLDIVDVGQWRRAEDASMTSGVTCPAVYRPHALATARNESVCIVLSPNHEIKILAEGVEMFRFSNARWHLLDLQSKYDIWAAEVGNAPLAERLLLAALDLADARQGALFVVLRDRAALPVLVAPQDQLDSPIPSMAPPDAAPTRAQLMHMLRGRTVTSIDQPVLEGLARIDGATVVDTTGRLLAVGAILLHPDPIQARVALPVEGARTTAAMAAARYGAVLKVSEDGMITFYDRQEWIWDI